MKFITLKAPKSSFSNLYAYFFLVQFVQNNVSLYIECCRTICLPFIFSFFFGLFKPYNACGMKFCMQNYFVLNPGLDEGENHMLSKKNFKFK